jgi:hypothetical protein
MYGKHSILTASCGFSLGLVVSACHGSAKNAEHCYFAAGNETCVERYGSERPYCAGECDPGFDANYGCVADEPTNLDCYAPCGGEQSANEDMSCLGIADETATDTGNSETSESTDTTETETGPGPCVMDEDCTNPDAPFCGDQGTCVDCGGTTDPNAACMSADPGMPVCSEGACVQCSAQEPSACMGVTPICDEGTNACVGCSEHAQCPNSACNLELGNCMDVANVVHVDGDGGQMFSSLGMALDLNAVPELTIVLHEKNNATPYTESVLLDTGTYVAILAAPGEEPVVTGTGGSPSFAVTTGSTLYLHEVSGSGTQNAGRGLEVNGATAWVQRSKLVNNTGGGILVDGGGELVLENSFLGGLAADVSALEIAAGSATVVYSTIAASAVSTTAVECVDGLGSTIRNSIVVFNNGADPDGGELMCPNVELVTNAFEGVFANNVSLGDMNPMWFVGFNSGDFSLNPLMAPAILATTATWESGDPATDIDGDARPTTPGTADYAGADIP